MQAKDQSPLPSIRFVYVVRDVLIVWGVVLLSSFLIVTSMSFFGGKPSAGMMSFSAFCFGAVGFAIAGCLTSRNRYRHLMVVSLVFWFSTLLGLFLSWLAPIHVVVALPAVWLMMLIGYGHSRRILPESKNE